MKTIINILFFISLFLVSNSLRISIVPTAKNSFYRDYFSAYAAETEEAIPPRNNKVDTLTKVCENIISTYQTLGKESFDNYKGCVPAYEGLGIKDPVISTLQPNCFTSLANFFCDNYIQKNGPKTRKNEEMKDKDTVQFILNSISHCINDNSNTASSTVYRCPTLNTDTFLINDDQLFCKGLVKLNLVNETTMEKKKLDEEGEKVCLRIVGNYNSCIKADNLLFVKSNYERCFEAEDTFYDNNEIMQFNVDEKEICLNFALPMIASIAFHSDNGRVTPDICESFDTTMEKVYNKLKTDKSKLLHKYAEEGTEEKNQAQKKFIQDYIERLENQESFLNSYFDM